MKNKLYKLLAALICTGLILLQSSCKKNWLDKNPDISVTVPSSLTDLQDLLDNAPAMNYSPSFGEIGSDGHHVTESAFKTYNDMLRNAYTWSHNALYQNISDWQNSNRCIYYCNLILETINKITPAGAADQATWNSIRGQALFQRAKSIYELSQVWAPPYDTATAKTQLGMVLRISSDINTPAERATLQQTYDQVINDLTTAKSLLEVIPLYKTRGSRPAVFGLLARIYLSMEDYADAKLNADSCLTLYSTLLDYNSLSASGGYPIARLNNEVIFHSLLYTLAPANQDIRIDTVLYHQYSDNDLRKKMFFTVVADTNITFKGSYNGTTQSFNGLAVDEQYLIRAECNARAGNANDALTDLNTLLSKRYKEPGFTALTAVNADDALTQVLAERKKELLLRGLRWSDLRRLNRDPRFTVTIVRTAGGNTYTLEPNSYQYSYPIPDDEIRESGIQQNNGW